MKTIKKALIFLFCMLLSHNVMAQLNTVAISMDGSKVTFGVRVEGVGMILLDTYGNIVRMPNIMEYGDYEYYSDFHSYEAGKIKKLGNVLFEYYSDFRGYEAGKIKKIGNVSFEYYSDFRKYESGKLKSIGGKAITYCSDFRSYEAGKLSSVAGAKISYYSDFNDYEAGKIKSIGTHKYEYFSDFGSSELAGMPKSGSTRVSVSGINFIVNTRHRY